MTQEALHLRSILTVEEPAPKRPAASLSETVILALFSPIIAVVAVLSLPLLWLIPKEPHPLPTDGRRAWSLKWPR